MLGWQRWGGVLAFSISLPQLSAPVPHRQGLGECQCPSSVARCSHGRGPVAVLLFRWARGAPSFLPVPTPGLPSQMGRKPSFLG